MCFGLLNLESKKIINSKDVVWLANNFKVWPKSKLLTEKHKFDDNNDDFTTKVKELLSEKTKDKVYCQLEQ